MSLPGIEVLEAAEAGAGLDVANRINCPSPVS